MVDALSCRYEGGRASLCPHVDVTFASILRRVYLIPLCVNGEEGVSKCRSDDAKECAVNVSSR